MRMRIFGLVLALASFAPLTSSANLFFGSVVRVTFDNANGVNHQMTFYVAPFVGSETSTPVIVKSGSSTVDLEDKKDTRRLKQLVLEAYNNYSFFQLTTPGRTDNTVSAGNSMFFMEAR